MTYKAVIHSPNGDLESIKYDTTWQAEDWICQNDNNLEYQATVYELNEQGTPVDWYRFC